MRHLFGVLLGLAVSAALFFGVGYGVNRIIALRGTVTSAGAQHALTSTHGLIAIGVLVATGLLIGILMLVPVSPLATALPGLALLGWSALVVLHNRYAARYFPLPNSHFGQGTSFLLFSGVLAMLGAIMIIPLFVPSRWRGRGSYLDDIDEDEDVSVEHALGLVP